MLPGKPVNSMDEQDEEKKKEKKGEEGERYSLVKFKLYETRSKFYMIGRDESRTHWRVLKIDRSETSELIIDEDFTTYTQRECQNLLQRIADGNRSTGGLVLVTKCYGIVGFIKFLEPYYMILITKRRKVGTICGHTIYGISESRIIPVPHPTILTNVAYSKDEQRYKKLLSTVDLTKDFFFSYTYHIMWSLQRNSSVSEEGDMPYERLFVWNEFLTCSIQQCMNKTRWTVALVYGFIKQAKISLNGRTFWLTLIARRSRYYAGTRYLKRGVNDKGRVANDVETEQIVFDEGPDGCPGQISSVVQNRGSIPLYWSQETSRLNLKPDIILHNKDPTYQATRLHFENLAKRYGNPIIVLNLIKQYERKPREATLHAEFAKAVKYINRNLSEESCLKFINWDFHKHFRSKENVLSRLEEIVAGAFHLTGFYYSGTSDLRVEQKQQMVSKRDDVVEACTLVETLVESEQLFTATDDGLCTCTRNANTHKGLDSLGQSCKGVLEKKALFQKGVLRTNCIDCLDRTNVAQYAYGLVALGHQLYALGLIDSSKIDPDNSLGKALMGLYENMGDTLALQYGGSAAHNKVFSERRGRWRATTESQEFFRTLQRYYRNAYLDAEKQDAINVFLGYFQPQHGHPALWELHSDQHCNIGRYLDNFVDKDTRSSFKRSLSDGSMLIPNGPGVSNSVASQNSQAKVSKTKRPIEAKGTGSPSENGESYAVGTSYARVMPSQVPRRLFNNSRRHISLPCNDNISESGQQDSKDGFTDSQFNDYDWLASSGNSCEEDSSERCSITASLDINENHNMGDRATRNQECNEYNGSSEETNVLENTDEAPNRSELPVNNASRMEFASVNFHQTDQILVTQEPLSEFSRNFIQWIYYGQTLCN